MSGMEIMLKSMGLGHVIEMAQRLANDGTLEKIVKFADGLDEMNARLARIENLLNEWNGYDSDGNIIRTGSGPLEPDTSAGRLIGHEQSADNGAGVSGQSGAD